MASSSTTERATGRLARLQAQLDVPVVPDSICSEQTSASDDVVVVSALRTPIGKAKRGAMKDTTPDQLLAAVLRATIDQTGINPASIGEITVGNVKQEGAGAAGSRMAQLMAGIPYTVPLSAVNRQCSSGLQAFANVASGIKAGYFDIGVACGVESMSSSAKNGPTMPEVDWSKVGECAAAQSCTVSMGMTSENVAEKFSISRQAQDTMGAQSQQKALFAQQNGYFDAEIVPITVTYEDKNGEEQTVTVSKDEGVRPGTTAEKLARLRPAFKPDGSATAGNSSQVSDGAAAVLAMRRSEAQRLGLPILGRFVSYAVVGVDPTIMGVGPAEAIPAALSKAGLTVDDIALFEINEAFASQATYCVQQLGIPDEKLNPNGGAIALGHPLGCTGARQIATLLHEMRRRGGPATGARYGVVSMCIGTGMGAAAVFESEQ